MEELVFIDKNNVAVCDSLQVAEKFKKRHDTVIRAIHNLRKNVEIEKRKMFLMGNYKDSQGRTYQKYIMNRQGFTVLVMGFNGKEAMHWKLMYSDAFDRMEKIIQERSSVQWQQTRLAAKDMRKLETAEIKELVQYAQSQGSKNAKKYYLALSKLANKTIGLSGGQREQASITQLNTLTLVENMIHHVIREGIEKQLPYKEIYQICKARLEQFKEITYLELGGILK